MTSSATRRPVQAVGSRRGARESGFALFSVLAAIVLLALIAGSLTLQSGLAARTEANAWRQIQEEALAESAISRAILAILESASVGQYNFEGLREDITIDGVRISVWIFDELGKIDLNGADADTLAALFVAAGAERSDASQVVGRVLDWRMGEARQARRRLPPSGDGAFQTIDELLLIEGVDPPLFERLRPGVTVHAHTSGVNIDAAPAIVRSTLAQSPPLSANAAALAPRRIAAADRGVTDWQIAAFNGRAFSIEVELTSATRRKFSAIIRFTGTVDRPYWILERSGF